MAKETKKKKKQYNWKAISRHYRAGVRSLRDIGSEFGLTEGAIRKRAKKEEWPRDLSKQIKAKADDLVRKEAIRKGTQGVPEKELIDSEAAIQAHVRLTRRKDVPKKKELVSKLYAKIESLVDNEDISEKMIEALKNADMNKLAELARKVVSIPGLIKSVAELTGAYKTLTDIESKVFNLGDSVGDEIDLLSAVLKEVAKRGKPLVSDDDTDK